MAVSTKDLEERVRTLNSIMGLSDKTKQKFEISGAYGGHQLELAKKGAGVVTYSGYESKADLFMIIGAMIKGISAYQNRVKIKAGTARY